MQTEFTLNEFTCDECGDRFEAAGNKRRFCSRACYQKWWLINVKEKANRGRRLGRAPDPEPDPIPDDNTLWALRGNYWLGEAKISSLETGRNRKSEPMILTGHGVYLGVSHGALLIRNGFTHYPNKRQQWRLFPGDRKLPSRIILLDTDGSISLDVLEWLAARRIPLIMLNYQGEVKSYIAETGSADLKLREAQLAALNNDAGLKIATRLIQEKIRGCGDTIRSLPKSPAQHSALMKLDVALQELSRPIADVEALRLIEGRAALSYFTAWQSIPIRWKGVGRHPIPLEWMAVGQRQSLISGTNRNAGHPVNAMLNYAYGVLESQVRIATVAAGFDTGIGYLHACRPGRSALVYDLMEPLRPRVDRLVLDFIRSHTFTPSDFPVTKKGVCRLHPQLAKKVAGLAVADERVREGVEGIL